MTMIIYFSLLFFSTLFTAVSQKSRSLLIARTSMMLTFIAMVLVAGLRSRDVGTDTWTYTVNFERIKLTINSIYTSSMEIGYLAIAGLAQIISNNYWSLLLLIALLTVSCHLLSIYMFSFDRTISVFVFISMGFYTFFFNGARQGLACAIYTLAFGSLIRGDFKKYLLIVILAFFFHKSIIIAIPLYFIFRIRSKTRYLFFISIISSISIVWFEKIIGFGVFVSEKYARYTESSDVGGYLLALSYVLLSCGFVFMRSRISEEYIRYYNIFLNINVFGSTIFSVVVITGGYLELTRLSFYFIFSSVFLWPLVLKSIYSTSEKGIFYISFFIGHLTFFYFYLKKMSNLIPYEINEFINISFII